LGPEAWLARWIIDPPMVPTLTWRVIFADGVAFFFPGSNLARDALRRPQSHADAHFVSCNEMGGRFFQRLLWRQQARTSGGVSPWIEAARNG